MKLLFLLIFLTKLNLFLFELDYVLPGDYPYIVYSILNLPRTFFLKYYKIRI